MEFVSSTLNESPELGSEEGLQSSIDLLSLLNEGKIDPRQAIAFAEKQFQLNSDTSWYVPIGLAYWKLEQYPQAWEILNKVDDSVLWLLEDNKISNENLKKEATKRNVNPERIIFAKKTILREHLARHKLANLFLDTFIVGAHTTCSDALWSGLPVLTKTGSFSDPGSPLTRATCSLPSNSFLYPMALNPPNKLGNFAMAFL